MEDDKAVLRWNFRVVIFFLLLPRTTSFQDCPSTVVGVADSNIIPDSSFTATSHYDRRYTAVKARFNSDKGWGPEKTTDPNDYLQIDLGKVFVICGVATKGAKDVNEWTTKYNISTSLDGTTYTWYPDNNPKAFTGNTDRDTAVKHTLGVPVKAKLIRFTPIQYNNFKVLRVELYGVYFKDFGCQSLPIGISNVAKIPDSRMMSSSEYNTSTKASHGRLGYTAGSSWCSSTSDSSPYLQINLTGSYVICGVATQGDHMSKHWVQTYQIQTSSDGASFTEYQENNVIKEISGNVDSNTIAQSPLYNGVVGQYIRIKPKSRFGSTSCMRTELYGENKNTVCANIPIGIQRISLVPNHRFTASSHFNNHELYVPSNVRLRNSLCWTPHAQDADPWVQIDLGSVIYMCAVATQGSPNHDEFVKTYKLRMSLDNSKWEFYKENNVEKVFQGNADYSSIVKNTLVVPAKVKCLRFYPKTEYSYASLRVEVYGLPSACGTPFGLEKDGSKGSIAVMSSSDLDSAHNASHARLYGDASWCSKTSSTSEYVQIDFGQMVTLTGIATQGDHTMEKWVETYSIKYSIDGNQWNDYREGGGSAKTFQGNTDKNSIVVRWLIHPTTVRYIKVNPQTWNTAICMRLELFGCPSPSRLKISELSNQNLQASRGQHVTLTCKVDEPLVKYIEWTYDGTDVTDLSGGITQAASFAKSTLQINYTTADEMFNADRCFKGESNVICRWNIVCKIYYTKGISSANSMQGAEVKTVLDYPNAPSLQSISNVLATSVEVKWKVPTVNDSQSSIKNFIIMIWNYTTANTITVSNSPTTNHSITGLLLCTYYNVTVRAVSQLGEGPWSNIQSFRTASDFPSQVIAKAQTSTSVDVSWMVPSGIRCRPDRYKITFSTTPNGPWEEHVVNNVQTLSHTLQNLNKWTDYYIKVQIHSEKGYGPPTTAIKQRTLEDVPDSAPKNFQAKASSAQSFLLTWELPPESQRNGVIKGFNISYCKTSNCSGTQKQQQLQGNSTLKHGIDELEIYTEYSFKILAYTSVGEGPYTEVVKKRTLEGAPSEPRNIWSELIAPDESGPKIKLTWDRPLHFHAEYIRKYKISYSRSGDPKIIDMPLNNNRTTAYLDAYGGVTYDISVWAFTVADGPKIKTRVRTTIYAPPAPKQSTISNVEGKTATITLWKIPDINGPISEILVYVKDVEGGNKTRRSTEPSNPDCEAIASESFKLDANQTVFTLGDGKDYGGKKNEELNEGKMYKVYQCGVTRNNQKLLYGKTVLIAEITVPPKKGNVPPPDGASTALVATLVVVILVIAIVAVVVGVVFWKRRKNNTQAKDNMKLHSLENNDESNGNENQSGASAGAYNGGYALNENESDDADLYGNADAIRYQPIPVHKFNQYVIEKGASALKSEFKLFSTEHRHPWTVAKDPKNKPKNRYGNIIPYDHSRVVLQDTSNGSDYINASYIHRFDGTTKAYIATQGPKPTSVPDFWQMVWQENIKTIVMLTNIVEANKVKCHQYWPDQKETYGNFTVTLHRSDTMADYVVRALIICKDGESDSRQVHHFQYTSWPDKGVPQHATSVLGFRRKARSHYNSCSSTAPLLVHCSAGVGRTGAFIAIDAMMERVKKEKTIDIFNYVQIMRENRCMMIQTEDQYVFVHRAIQEAITCGNTEIPVLNLIVTLNKLSKPRPTDQKTGYDLEWKRLAEISPKVTDEVIKAGQQQNNRPRNRYQDVIPFDSARVFLSRESNNYINASFADAFRERNMFIMTQAPLENTVSDFWYMIHQYNIGCIVMLNKVQEENESFLQYWPKSGTQSYNETTVEVKNESKSGPLVIFKCVINHSSDPKPHNLVHIQHTDWPKDGVPSNCQSVLDLVDRVQKAQQQSCNTPIAVQCSDGVGRSGTFCAIYSTLERVKSEQVVDVFQAIKVLRLGRPNAVSTLEQYKFCYKMVQVYLDSFNDYANFNEV